MIYIMKHKEYDNPIPKDYEEILIGDLFKHYDMENINVLNLFLNEVTGLYHVWKHKKDEYVGLCHYRRMFWYNDDYLKMKDAKKILENYDMIITHDVIFQRSIYEQLRVEFENPDIYDKYYKKFCDAVPRIKRIF